jgi:carboxypeptidase C (cathepsin A)
MIASAASPVRKRTAVLHVLAVVVTLLSAGVIAQQTSATTPAAPPAATAPAKEPDTLPPLPPDAHVAQTMQLGGRALNSTATVGTSPVYATDGKKIGEVVFTSYTMDGAERPVTFAMNGGPGASSVYLNFGAFGPKRAAFGDEGQSPSDPANLMDNPGTWLDFTDLVFIDPIGTGFSRSLAAADVTKREF